MAAEDTGATFGIRIPERAESASGSPIFMYSKRDAAELAGSADGARSRRHRR
jgi:hypothetical protein